MFKYIKALYENKIQQLKTANSLSRMEEAYASNAMYYANSQYIDTDAIRYGWNSRVNTENGIGLEHNFGNGLDSARTQARRLIREYPHARNMHNQFINYIVGPGFSVNFRDENIKKSWVAKSKLIKFNLRKYSIIRRIFRDGEAFLRKFPNGQIRFIEPELIKTPPEISQEIKNSCYEGILLDNKDSETILGYFVFDSYNSTNWKFVSSTDVFHFKDPFSDIACPRGWPPFFDAIPAITRYEKWIQCRATLNQLRSSIYMFRKHKGAAASNISNFANTIKSGTYTKPDGKQQNYALPIQPGSVVDHSEDVEYEYKGPQLEARDASSDGRSMALLVCAYFSSPEYLLTCDASNSNFSSSLVAEAPGIVAMRTLQGICGEQLNLFFDWLMGMDVEPELTFPTMVVRNPLQEVQALEIEKRNRIVSTRTWRSKRDYDYDLEELNVKHDIATEPPPIAPVDNRNPNTNPPSVNNT